MSEFQSGVDDVVPPPAEPPNPRRPLTKAPKVPLEPTTQRLREQQQQHYQQEQEQQEGTGEFIPPPPEPEQQKPFFTDEYDEDRELRAKSMPTIYSFASPKEQLVYMYGPEATEENVTKAVGPIRYREGLTEVLTTPNFNIKDIHIKDVSGKNTIGTFAVIWINPFAQVLPLHIKSTTSPKEEDSTKQKRIIYEVLFGQGQLVIGNLTKRVMKSDIFWVEPGIEHNFFNTTHNPLVVRLFYDGHVDLRDRYFPKARANEVAKESRREIFNVQNQKNTPVNNSKEKRAKSEDTFA